MKRWVDSLAQHILERKAFLPPKHSTNTSKEFPVAFSAALFRVTIRQKQQHALYNVQTTRPRTGLTSSRSRDVQHSYSSVLLSFFAHPAFPVTGYKVCSTAEHTCLH